MVHLVRTNHCCSSLGPLLTPMCVPVTTVMAATSEDTSLWHVMWARYYPWHVRWVRWFNVLLRRTTPHPHKTLCNIYRATCGGGATTWTCRYNILNTMPVSPPPPPPPPPPFTLPYSFSPQKSAEVTYPEVKLRADR